ncbi:hypothetical protein AXK11_04430 [Cephaloticoccus primus]|uniref:Ribonuclease 3 n=1 Tax=Cephaloticoccus primus TaxID=1548207 RepID=A0A139SPV5_9BACT|nr:ribonuclease III [Cephaloticoccus primus]KXU36491.1 hypothetical protein AXK11_04430 [Cephaloticoccus primus]
MKTPSLETLQQRLGYRFRDRALLELALAHPSSLASESASISSVGSADTGSAARDRPQSNQRLEFLGDSVLQLILTEALYRHYPDEREGALSTKRFSLVKGSQLSALAREIALYDYIRVGASERTAGSDASSLRDSILEDALEALIAAVYLDSDLATARDVVLRLYGSLPEKLALAQPTSNPKGRLQEHVQPLHGNHALRYETVATHGEAHAREFEVALYLHDRLLATGRGSSKQRAEEAAARSALAEWPSP